MSPSTASLPSSTVPPIETLSVEVVRLTSVPPSVNPDAPPAAEEEVTQSDDPSKHILSTYTSLNILVADPIL